MTSRSTARALGAASFAVLVLLAAGCGGKDGASAEEAPAQAEPQAGVKPAGTEAPQPPQAGLPGDPSAPAVDGAPRAPARADTGDRTTAFDLVDNRLLAHLHRGGGVHVPMGDRGALKYTQGTWKAAWTFGRKVDGVPVALTDGVQGIVRVPMDAAACASGCELAFRVSPYGTDQRVDVFVGDVKLPTQELASGFQTKVVKIPDGAIKDGENKLRFHFRRSVAAGGDKTAGAFDWIAVRPSGAASEEPARSEALVTKVDGRRAIDGGAFDEARWYVQVPKDARLELTPAAAPGATFRVDVASALDGKARTLAEGAADGEARSIDLAELAGHTVRLALVAKGPVKLVEPRITVPRPKATAARKPVRNVIIWMVDTLRADKLKVYNPSSRVQTPNMDRLVREGVTFLSATVQGGHSIPSHASLLTGLYPEKHGHTTAETKLGRELDLLPEVFKTAGFATAGYLANGYVSVKWGFKQGFDTYKNYIRDEQPAATAHLLKDALPWVERNKGERMFMYLATVDPHVNYRWRDAYSLQYDPEPYRGPVERSISGHFLNRILEKKVTLGERDKQRVIATYDGEVSYNDAQLGKLLEHLSALGILDETAILITADHGEEFWDHGGVGHGRSLYQELISVPFILWRPGALPEGRVVEGDVEIVDVMATLLSLAGLEAGPAVQGSDLLPVARGEVPDLPTPAFASHGSMSRSLKMGRWKYILRGGDNDDLFDLSADPTEQKDVKVDHPIAHRWARDVMAFWLSYNERWSKRTWGVPSNHAAGLVESL